MKREARNNPVRSVPRKERKARAEEAEKAAAAAKRRLPPPRLPRRRAGACPGKACPRA